MAIMKNTLRITFCGIITALSVSIMLLAYFPYFTYAMPAIAGCFLIFLVFEAGKKYAFVVYAAVCILSFIICEKESSLCYILFFGYYPIIKAVIEKIRSTVLEWIVKLGVFNIAFAAILLIGTFVFGLDAGDMGEFGKYTALVLFVCGNIMFLAYDVCISRLVALYVAKYRNKIRKYIG